MNRIETAILATKSMIETQLKLGKLTAETIDDLNKSTTLSVDEFCSFQEMKSLAQMDGRLSLDEAMSIYGYLGAGSPTTFNNQPIEVKIVLMFEFKKLMSKG